MSEETDKAADKLRKLGERLRAGAAIRHPLTEKELEVLRIAVREQAHQQQVSKDNTERRSDPPGREREH